MNRGALKGVVLLSILTLLGGCFGGSDSSDPGTALPVKVEKLKASPNPTGIEIGFWPTYNQHKGVFDDFGKRPVTRIEFKAWKKIEEKQGQYNWTGVFDNMKMAHRFGQTPIVAIDISFSSQITKGDTTIPSFYYPRITNSQTREAAKKFLYAYVQELLTQVGSVKLSIDYEIVSNYKLHEDYDGKRRKEWSEWYIEAAKVARQAAADLGKAEQLKLVPIVNGNPLKPASAFYGGAKANPWLLDVVAVSDYLGVDIYQIGDPEGPELDVTDPQSFFDVLSHFVDNYAGDKEVIACENGFTTVTEHFPDITWRTKGKYAGTEEQQREYYQNLLPRLEEANKPDGILRNKIRGYNFWSYKDSAAKEPRKGDYEKYFGLVRLDGTPKPAAEVVKTEISRLETDPFSRPVNVAKAEDATARAGGADAAGGIILKYVNGNDYDFLKVELPAGSSRLSVATEKPGYLLAHLNHRTWVSQTQSAKTEFELNLADSPSDNEPISVELYFTGDVFPFEQQVKSIKIGDAQ